MSICQKRLPAVALTLVASAFLSLGPAQTPSVADGPGAGKAPEVSTVGTGPYAGPSSEELAKLAQVQATSAATSSPTKGPEVVTMAAGGDHPLTQSEEVKLAEFLAVPAILAIPIMPKLEVMHLLTVGTPDLTPQEREKRARELASRVPTTPMPASGSGR
jgi:hypothetical protein